jgi:hypothetical protein
MFLACVIFFYIFFAAAAAIPFGCMWSEPKKYSFFLSLVGSCSPSHTRVLPSVSFKLIFFGAGRDGRPQVRGAVAAGADWFVHDFDAMTAIVEQSSPK